MILYIYKALVLKFYNYYFDKICDFYGGGGLSPLQNK